MLIDKDYKDLEVIVVFGFREVIGEFDKSIFSKGF